MISRPRRTRLGSLPDDPSLVLLENSDVRLGAAPETGHQAPTQPLAAGAAHRTLEGVIDAGGAYPVVPGQGRGGHFAVSAAMIYRAIESGQLSALKRGRGRGTFIRSSEYRPGHELPSGSVLMARYGVAHQTVQNAIDVLRAEGACVGRQGAGWFCARRRSWGVLSDAAEGGWTPSVQVTLRREPADERTATELRITADAEILVRDRVTSADGHPIQLANSRLPRSLTKGTRIERGPRVISRVPRARTN
jgi:regulatory GntR family protein/UTRA domain-containing protein